MLTRIEAQLKTLPAKPGVYLFRDGDGRVLYIGKAKSLRSARALVFPARRRRARPDGGLVERITDVEVIVTGTEVEALHVEQNLVKRHRPPFNIRLRDDKSFPYIAVTVEDEYPRVMFTRERHRRGVVYFGPYANAKKVRETLDVLNRVFQYRPCEGPQPGRHSGIPCLDYHIERCKAPCVGYIDKEDVPGGDRPRDRVPLRARRGRSCGELERRMQEASAAERFEEAARYRNRLFSIRHLAERQAADKRAVGTWTCSGSRSRATGPRCRSSRCGTASSSTATRSTSRTSRGRTRRRCWRPSASSTTARRRASRRSSSSRATRATRPRWRSSSPTAAARASRSARPSGVRSGASRSSPTRTRDRGRVGPAPVRAAAAAPGGGARGAARGAQPREPADPDRVLRHLQHPGRVAGRLDGRLPGRGAEEGPLPQVRRPRLEGPDDFAAIEEVVSRRFARLADGTADDYDESFAATPNLVVIDGGKGQLSAALAAMQAYDLPRVAVISLAKREEEVFVPGRPEPIVLARDSAGLQLLQRIRDEAHRFALGFHRQRREAKARGSIFDDLQGVGPVRRRALIRHFGSAERLLDASQEELEGVPGRAGEDRAGDLRAAAQGGRA